MSNSFPIDDFNPFKSNMSNFANRDVFNFTDIENKDDMENDTDC